MAMRLIQPVHLPQIHAARHDFVHAGLGGAPVERTLVVVFLRGGADGMTLVPPAGDDAYHRARPTLAVRDVIDLDGYFGLNRALSPLLRHLEAGRMGIVHGAGSEDATRSHFEAQDTMEHGGAGAGSGWLARCLRARSTPPSALCAVSIGTTRPESLRGAPGGAVMQTVADFALEGADAGLLDDLARLYAVESGALGAAGRDTIEAVRRLRLIRATNPPPEHGAVYPGSSFGRGLREISRLIKADLGLVASTIDLPGWDTHFVQGSLIGSLMRDLAEGLDAFMTDLGAWRERFTVVVMTEFGRRLRENTSFGTDHGAGSTMMVLGAGVAESGLAGVRSGWSDLAAATLDEVGDVPASINYRDVLAPILLHHHPDLDLASVFPGTYRNTRNVPFSKVD
jgi:uncharacterized protein (DUF1501 family)